jgi:hypothetical protein
MGDKLPGGRQPETEGERGLVTLGLAHLADEEMPTKDGSILGKDFLDVCGEHARPLLKGLETISPTDPRYEPAKKALQKLVSQYIRSGQPSK